MYIKHRQKYEILLENFQSLQSYGSLRGRPREKSDPIGEKVFNHRIVLNKKYEKVSQFVYISFSPNKKFFFYHYYFILFLFFFCSFFSSVEQ